MVLGVAVVGAGSGKVCYNMLSMLSMIVMPSPVRYWWFNWGNIVSVMWLLTNAVPYVWAVWAGMPALWKKLNQSSFTCSITFRILVGWTNTMANKIQATNTSHLLLYRHTNAKMKSLLTQQPLTTINLSFSREKLSKTIKFTEIIPVFKNDDKLDYNNYKSVAILPNLSKISGKLMHHRLTLFLENNRKFLKFQFEFRPLYDTCFNHTFRSI